MRSISKLSLALSCSAIAIAACSPNNLDKSDTSIASAKSYTITRQFQRVVRYNCGGQVTSDKTETVAPPNIYVQISPQNGYHLDHSAYLNLTTGSSPGCIVSQTQFSIDTSPTACNMQVNPGLNQIQYSFYYCDGYTQQTDGNQICTTPLHIDETGKIYINVVYQEETLNGSSEVKPDPTQCQQSKPMRSKK